MLQLVQTVAVWALPVLFAYCVHAMVMAHMAWRLGDRSDAMRERLSLNPLTHADPFGTLLLPALMIGFNTGLIIGWPKPVPLNPGAFAHPRKDVAAVSVVALGSNVIMAVAWGLLLKVAMSTNAQEGLWYGIAAMANAGVIINVVFLVFGLLPIPGFAGGHVIGAILPPPLAQRWYASQNLVAIAFIVIIVSGAANDYIMTPILKMEAVIYRVVGITA